MNQQISILDDRNQLAVDPRLDESSLVARLCAVNIKTR